MSEVKCRTQLSRDGMENRVRLRCCGSQMVNFYASHVALSHQQMNLNGKPANAGRTESIQCVCVCVYMYIYTVICDYVLSDKLNI